MKSISALNSGIWDTTQPKNNDFRGQRLPIAESLAFNGLHQRVERVIGSRQRIDAHEARILAAEIMQHNSEELAHKLILSKLVTDTDSLIMLVDAIKTPSFALDILDNTRVYYLPEKSRSRLLDLAGLESRRHISYLV